MGLSPLVPAGDRGQGRELYSDLLTVFNRLVCYLRCILLSNDSTVVEGDPVKVAATLPGRLAAGLSCKRFLH